MFVLAHLSDTHIPLEGRIKTFELLSKRAIGYVNWLRGRNRVHRGDIARALLEDLQEQSPDHIAMTGDLVNVGAHREWQPARDYMQLLGDPEHVSAVPGNHDAYVGGALSGMRETYRPYTSLDDIRISAESAHLPSPGEIRKLQDEDGFPYLRKRGELAIIGVSTAVPTAPFMSTGKIGKTQLAGLDKLLDILAHQRLYRVVLIHHPPLRELAEGRRGLTDAKAFGKIIAAHGADLILHGHNHTSTLEVMRGKNGPVPVVGVPSASARRTSRKPPAGYALYKIEGQPGGRKVTFVRRGLSPDYREGDEPKFIELTRQPLHPTTAQIAVGQFAT